MIVDRESGLELLDQLIFAATVREVAQQQVNVIGQIQLRIEVFML